MEERKVGRGTRVTRRLSPLPELHKGPPPCWRNEKEFWNKSDRNTFDSAAAGERQKTRSDNNTPACTMHITFRFLPLLIVIGLAASEKCPSLKSPDSFDKNQFIGKWYAVRGIEHTDKANSSTSKHSKKCSEIIITAKNGGESWKFNWNSKNKPAKQFTLKHNAKTPGRLEGNGKGSFSALQITKIPNEPTMWIATFCRSNGGVSSVVLSDAAVFNKEKVDKVTKALAEQGVDVSNHYDRCEA